MISAENNVHKQENSVKDTTITLCEKNS